MGGVPRVLLVVCGLCVARILLPWPSKQPQATNPSLLADSQEGSVGAQISTTGARLRVLLQAAPSSLGWKGVAQYVADNAVSEQLVPVRATRRKSKVTFVSGMWDYRELDPDCEKVYGKSMEDMAEQFGAGIGSIPNNKVLFVDEWVYSRVRTYTDESTTRFVILPLHELRRYWGEVATAINDIRTSSAWLSQASWLASSPQAQTLHFNLIGLSKVLLLREAARRNAFDTETLFFVDARDECAVGWGVHSDNADIFNLHADTFLATYFNYQVSSEVHGFPASAWRAFVNPTPDNRYRILKGTLFGGKPANIELMAVLFEVVARATLTSGSNAMGVDECIWSILWSHFPSLFHLFSNDDSCVESTEPDHSCPGFTNPAHQCALHEWAVRGPPSRNTPQ